MKKSASSFNKNIFYLVLFCLVLLKSSILFAQKTETDTIAIKDIAVKEILVESTKSNGLAGIKVNIILENTLAIVDSLHIHYNLNGDAYTRKFSALNKKTVDNIAIFHPFSILYKTSGEHSADFELDNISDTSKKNTYKITGIKTQNASIVVPKLHTFQIKVNYTEVSPKTPKGNEWDFYLFTRKKSDTYPDLIYTIEAAFNEESRGIFSGQFYRAHKQKDTLIASWPYYSSVITYCEGDELSLCIKDADIIFHDTIGCISIYELISKKQSENLQFGSVLNFSCEVVSD